ncbi:MAG: hypothetical protein M9920_13615 [Verrucomicrobiae bacterium]|nr:hypothetical protein [Verrucomicrobiae bacterium]
MGESSKSKIQFQPLNQTQRFVTSVLAIGCFHLAYTPANPGSLSLAILGYVIALTQLARLPSPWLSFYFGLVVGFACVAPQLECFWRIFGPAAVPLWLILAFWIALFTTLSHVALAGLGAKRAALLIPFFWCGLEYFRSELYFLKFSWLNVGYAFAAPPFLAINRLGMYGVGFLAALLGATFIAFHFRKALLGSVIIVAFAILLATIMKSASPTDEIQSPIRMAGIQLEFPSQLDLAPALEKHASTNAAFDLLVLPENTLEGGPSDLLRNWCRTQQKFLIVGGKDESPTDNFYNTAFVVGTNGDTLFQQAKSVPVQFFKDGLPASHQKLWDSPWGRLGICICYDLSYTRVTDELVRQGAQLLIVPTMDVIEWGRHEHELHARVAPVRAMEYGLPIFRVASSGISQGVDYHGQVQSRAPFPGEGEVIRFKVSPVERGSRPPDRWLAWGSVILTALFIAWLPVARWRERRRNSKPSDQVSSAAS